MNAFLIPGVLIATVAALRGMWSPCGLSMISSITPMAERSKGHRFGVTATWFTLGGLAGGVTLGAGMALGAWAVAAGGIGKSVTVAVFGVAALVTVASDLELFGFRLPIHPRQVNETWLPRLRPWAYASGFGWQIGCGFATYIMTGAVYLTVAAGVLSADPVVAFALGVLFGTVRGLCVFTALGADDPASLRRLHATIDRFTSVSLDVAIAAQVVGVGLLAFTGGYPVPLVAAGVAACLTVAVRVGHRRGIADPLDGSPGVSSGIGS